MSDDKLPAWWCEKEIQVGAARVIWVEATTRNQAGWPLPGGEITQDKHRAWATAVLMDREMRR